MAQKATVTPQVIAERMHKPGWKDPKLLIGLLLILLSVLAVIGVMRATNKTQNYYIAAHDIKVGDEIRQEDLTLSEVRLGDSENLYLSADDALPDYARANQNIPAGALLQQNTVKAQDHDGRRLATVVMDSTIASSFTTGDRVDIWVSKKKDNGTAYSEPQVVMQAAEVSGVHSEESMIGSTGKSAVQLLVTDDALAEVLNATNNENKINLVPTTFGQK